MAGLGVDRAGRVARGGATRDLDLFTYQVYSRIMICRVNLTRATQKQLRKVPRHVAVKLKAWVGR